MSTSQAVRIAAEELYRELPELPPDPPYVQREEYLWTSDCRRYRIWESKRGHLWLERHSEMGVTPIAILTDIADGIEKVRGILTVAALIGR